jgi:peptidoglycan/LPS O-acetylase OafA/YrhL
MFMVDSKRYSHEIHADYFCQRCFRSLQGLALMMMPSLLGLKHPLGSVLGWKPLQLLSKLTFTAFLVHVPIMNLLLLEYGTGSNS